MNQSLAKFAITFNAIIFLILIPYLEIGVTHVINPDWPGHARLHEVWQLLTNAGLSILACVWVWKNKPSGIGLGLLLALSFLIAWGLKDTYGGSMVHSDGSEATIAGMNLAVLVMLANGILLGASITWKLPDS